MNYFKYWNITFMIYGILLILWGAFIGSTIIGISDILVGFVCFFANAWALGKQ